MKIKNCKYVTQICNNELNKWINWKQDNYEIISVISPIMDEEKLKKRAERFGITTPTVANAAVDEQKRKRAERFGLAA